MTPDDTAISTPKPMRPSRTLIPEHLRNPTQAVGREVSLLELSDRHICAALGKLVLTRSAWTCFSLRETSKLLRPLQIHPELTGTYLQSPEASAEIIYKFQSHTGKIGMVKGMLSLEDFRGTTLRSLYQLLHVPQITETFMETVVPYVIDNLKLIITREEDEALWRETIYFTAAELRNSDFMIRGLVTEAIPRRFLIPLQQVYRVVSSACKEMPNVAFQVCLKAYFEYNEYPNQDLLILLISKYFYTLYRHCEIKGMAWMNAGTGSGIGPGLSQGKGPGYGLGGSGTVIPARLLTVDTDSDTSLESAGIAYRVVGITGSRPASGQQLRQVNEQELEQLRRQLQAAEEELRQTRRVVSNYQDHEKQDLVRRLQDVDKFLLFSLASFFDTMMFRLPQEVIDVYGSAWIPKTSMIDEKRRLELDDYLARVTQEHYLSKVSATEAAIIGYWETLGDSFYQQWVMGQYRKLERFEVLPEQAGIQVLEQDRFIHEVQLRFASRHEEIVKLNQAQITNILINHLAQRVAINTSQQSYKAMQMKLASVINMEISQNDVWRVRNLIETFVDRFMGQEETIRSPYPVGTILEVFRELESQERDGRTRLGLEIMGQIYQEYLL